MSVRILQGDCLSVLKTLPDESVHCVVCSPPYWGLRDYGVSGQLGLESTPQEYVEKMVAVFREVRRVLRDDATLWLNMGDGYAGSGRGGHVGDASTLEGSVESEQQSRSARGSQLSPGLHAAAAAAGAIGRAWVPAPDGLKRKDLCGIPWMLAFALRAGFARCDGCDIELRGDLWPVWNGHRVCLDCERAGKHGSHVIQSESGWYLRQDIIWSKPNPMPESVRDRCTKAHEYLFLLAKSERYYFDQDAILEPLSAGTHLRVSQASLAAQRGSDRVQGKTNGPMKAVVRKMAEPGEGIKNNSSMDAALVAPGRARKLEAQPAMPGTTIHNGLAGHSGSVLKRSGNKERKPASARGVPVDTDGKSAGDGAGSVPWEGYQRNKRSVWTVTTQPFKEAHFATFPPALIEPCILAGCPKGGTVLDPFFGAGTTGLVADRLGRDCIGIELNPAYVEMARKRITGDSPLFAEVA